MEGIGRMLYRCKPGLRAGERYMYRGVIQRPMPERKQRGGMTEALSLRVDEETLAVLESEAARLSLSISAALRMIVRQYRRPRAR